MIYAEGRHLSGGLNWTDSKRGCHLLQRLAGFFSLTSDHRGYFSQACHALLPLRRTDVSVILCLSSPSPSLSFPSPATPVLVA